MQCLTPCWKEIFCYSQSLPVNIYLLISIHRWLAEGIMRGPPALGSSFCTDMERCPRYIVKGGKVSEECIKCATKCFFEKWNKICMYIYFLMQIFEKIYDKFIVPPIWKRVEIRWNVLDRKDIFLYIFYFSFLYYFKPYKCII